MPERRQRCSWVAIRCTAHMRTRLALSVAAITANQPGLMSRRRGQAPSTAPSFGASPYSASPVTVTANNRFRIAPRVMRGCSLAPFASDHDQAFFWSALRLQGGVEECSRERQRPPLRRLRRSGSSHGPVDRRLDIGGERGHLPRGSSSGSTPTAYRVYVVDPLAGAVIAVGCAVMLRAAGEDEVARGAEATTTAEADGSLPSAAAIVPTPRREF